MCVLVCVSVCVFARACMHAHMRVCACTFRGQRRTLDSLELELHVFESWELNPSLLKEQRML